MWIVGGTPPDRSSSTTASFVAGSRHSSARRVRSSSGMPASCESCEVGRRQRGHQHADVHEQADTGVVEPGDHLDRRRCGRRIGRLLPLDLLVQHQVQLVQRRQEPPQEGLAGLADRQPDAGRAHAARGTELGEQEGQALGLVASLRRTEPVVEARPDDAHAAPGRVEIAPQRVHLVVGGDGERPPQLARFELDDVRDAVGHDPDGEVGRRALGADHVGRPVEGARSEGPSGGEFSGHDSSVRVRRHRGRRTAARPAHRAGWSARCGTAG